MIIVKNHKSSTENIKSDYPDAVVIDVTSHAKDEYIRLSPFYPHGGIPVPFSPGWHASCVEAIWQGLKVFQSVGPDYSLFKNTTMENLKRTTRRFGSIRGHRKGVGSAEILGYVEARKLIYLPTYKWVLDNKVSAQIAKIRQMAQTHTVVLLDYATNGNVDDPTKPLSHAALIKAYIEGNYPVYEGWDTYQDETVVNSFSIGDTVKHPKFGVGTVKSINGERITVVFETEGEKLLSLRLAKLEKL